VNQKAMTASIPRMQAITGKEWREALLHPQEGRLTCTETSVKSNDQTLVHIVVFDDQVVLQAYAKRF